MSGNSFFHVLPLRVRDFAPLTVAYYAMLWLLSTSQYPLIPAVVDFNLPRHFYRLFVSVINFNGCGRDTTLLLMSGAEVCMVQPCRLLSCWFWVYLESTNLYFFCRLIKYPCIPLCAVMRFSFFLFLITAFFSLWPIGFGLNYIEYASYGCVDI